MTAHMSMAIFLVQSANLNISPLNYFLLGGGGNTGHSTTLFFDPLVTV